MSIQIYVMSKKDKIFERYEFKYILDPVTYMKVRDFIDAIELSRDPNALSDVYTVTSLYFDTHGLDDYYDKAGGFLSRKKTRVRIYGSGVDDSTTEVHLELKNKHDMFISKDKIHIPIAQWQAFLDGDNDILLNKFKVHLLDEGRVPTVMVRYDREAFEETFFDRVRVTFDRNIELICGENLDSTMHDWHDIVPVSGMSTIMELKFSGRLPWWFGFMLRKFDLRRSPYSKYAEAVDVAYKYNPLPR